MGIRIPFSAVARKVSPVQGALAAWGVGGGMAAKTNEDGDFLVVACAAPAFFA